MSNDPMRELRQRTPAPDVSQIQPNAGWGDICVHCRYVYRDSAKYGADFKPDYPCVLVIHDGPSAFMPDLVRYTDGTESCNRYMTDATEDRE